MLTRMVGLRNVYKTFSKCRGRKKLGNLYVGGEIILKLILNKQCVKV